MSHRRIATTALLALLLFGVAGAHAEQMQRYGDWKVHYAVVPSEFVKPEIAERYGIIRGRDRSFLNVSVRDPLDAPAKAAISGYATSLLGQQRELEFREVSEDGAVYYLADLKHSDEEVLRFRIRIVPPGEREMLLEFQQKLYWEEP